MSKLKLKVPSDEFVLWDISSKLYSNQFNIEGKTNGMTVAVSCLLSTFHTTISYFKLQQLTPQLSEFQKKENKLNFLNIIPFLFIILVICHINYCMDIG